MMNEDASSQITYKKSHEPAQKKSNWNSDLRIMPVGEGNEAGCIALDDEGNAARFSGRDLAPFVTRSHPPDQQMFVAGTSRRNSKPTASDAEKRWHTHGWSDSLKLFIASRRHNFADRRDGETVRRATVEEFLKKEGPPPRLNGTVDILLKQITKPTELNLSVGDCAMKRRTTRVFNRDPLSLEAFSSHLWAGLRAARKALTKQQSKEPLTYFSNHGAAFEYFIIVYSVTGVAPGVYRYDVCSHGLQLIRLGDFRNDCRDILYGQSASKTAAYTIVLATDFRFSQWLYKHERALRMLYLDAGWIAQDLIWSGTAYCLGAFTTPATQDSKLIELIVMEPVEWSPIYTITFGANLDRSLPSGEKSP